MYECLERYTAPHVPNFVDIYKRDEKYTTHEILPLALCTKRLALNHIKLFCSTKCFFGYGLSVNWVLNRCLWTISEEGGFTKTTPNFPFNAAQVISQNGCGFPNSQTLEPTYMASQVYPGETKMQDSWPPVGGVLRIWSKGVSYLKSGNNAWHPRLTDLSSQGSHSLDPWKSYLYTSSSISIICILFLCSLSSQSCPLPSWKPWSPENTLDWIIISGNPLAFLTNLSSNPNPLLRHCSHLSFQHISESPPSLLSWATIGLRASCQFRLQFSRILAESSPSSQPTRLGIST